MTKPPFNSYGFTYECNGHRYSLDILASSEEAAKRQVTAMAGAIYEGQLRAVCRPECDSMAGKPGL